jgi:hypothetical protein
MTPKILVAIMSCHRLDYYLDDLSIDWCTQKGLRCLDQQARVNTIRDTWVKDLGDTPYKIFYGKTLRQNNDRKYATTRHILREPLADEIYLDCGDNYTENPAKMKAICRWALDHGYDYILRTDDDTFIYPSRIFATNWAEYDYSGSCATNDFHPGGCLFLSRRMMEAVIAAPVTNYADDVWMGKVAKDHRIEMHHIPNMRNQWGTGYKVPIDIDPTGIASFHSCSPDVMRRLYVAGKPTTSADGQTTS